MIKLQFGCQGSHLFRDKQTTNLMTKGVAAETGTVRVTHVPADDSCVPAVKVVCAH